MALPQPAAPASQDRARIRIDCRTTAETPPMQSTIHVYEVRLHKDKRGADLISDVLPFGRLWYDGLNAMSNAIGYATHYNRSHDAVIRVYEEQNE